MEQRRVWYELQALSETCHVPAGDLLRCVQEHGLPSQRNPNGFFVDRACFPRLFAILGKDLPRAFYAIPDNLKGGGPAWRTALRELYGEEFACPASLSPSQGELLRSLVFNLQPRVCLEIGCFVGASTLWIASALAELGQGHLHSVDLFGDKFPFGRYTYLYVPDAEQYIMRRLDQAGLLSRVTLHKGHSVAIGMAYAECVGEPLDFLFIDGAHTKEGCEADFRLYEPRLRPGGLLVLHDIVPGKCGWAGPRHVIDNVVRAQPERFDVLELPTAPKDYGMAVIRKKA
jgi:predicted O-methyltransferase YrrM